VILCFFYRNFLLFYKKVIKINIEVVKKWVRVWVRDYTHYLVGMRIGQNFNTRWVWGWGWG